MIRNPKQLGAGERVSVTLANGNVVSGVLQENDRFAGAMLVEIVGEDGLSGWGEAFGPAMLTAPIVDFYKPLLVGADAFTTELHWQNLYDRLRDHGQKGLAIEALSAVDIALSASIARPFWPWSRSRLYIVCQWRSVAKTSSPISSGL